MNFISGRLPRLAKIAERMTLNATDLRSSSTVLSRVAALRADTAGALNRLTQARGAATGERRAAIEARLADLVLRDAKGERFRSRIEGAFRADPAQALQAFRDEFYPKALSFDPETGVKQATRSLPEGLAALVGDGVVEAPTKFGYRGSVVPVAAGETAEQVSANWFSERTFDLMMTKAGLK